MSYIKQYILVFLIFFVLVQSLSAQDNKTDSTQIHLKNAAHKIISSAKYCALITVDEEGIPRARTMDPFKPDSNFVVWFGTNQNTRKVAQIKNNPIATLYYFDSQSESYVILTGKAIRVKDPYKFDIYWKEEWEEFYPDYPKNYLLIKFVPDEMEISSPAMGVYSDPETWQPPSIKFHRKNQ